MNTMRRYETPFFPQTSHTFLATFPMDNLAEATWLCADCFSIMDDAKELVLGTETDEAKRARPRLTGAKIPRVRNG